jgi:hypothetical protein
MKTHALTLRLAAAFGLLAIVLIVVGWQGVSHLRQQNVDLQSLVGNQWKEVQLEHQAFLLSELNSRLTLLLFFLDDPDEIKQMMGEREANTKQITALMAALDPLLDPDEGRLFATVKAARTPYIESYQEAITTLVAGNNRDAARKLMVENVRPKLMIYHNAWAAFDQQEAAGIDHIIQQSRAEYVTGVREFLSTMVLACAIASAIAIFTVIRLAREIAVRQLAEKSLQEGYDALDRRVGNEPPISTSPTGLSRRKSRNTGGSANSSTAFSPSRPMLFSPRDSTVISSNSTRPSNKSWVTQKPNCSRNRS